MVFGIAKQAAEGEDPIALTGAEFEEGWPGVEQGLREGHEWSGLVHHRRASGHAVVTSTRISPLTVEGERSTYLMICRDDTERVKAQRTNELLVRELKHRVSNLFATVQAMVRMSAREADLPAADAEELLARIGAMATAHRVSLEAAGGPVPLHELLTAMLEQVGPISFEGPSVMLPEDKMTPVSLILHELSTNALKYGAWARPEGRVHIHWAVERPPKRLVLQWRESGLDDVDPTALSARGFGTRLIEGAAWQLDGRYTRSLSGGELCNLLTVPL